MGLSTSPRLSALTGLLLCLCGLGAESLAQLPGSDARIPPLRIPREVSGIGGLQGDSPTGLTSMGPIRVMSYNIRYDNQGDGDHRWSNRAPLLTDVIRRHDPDVLGIQEGLHHQVQHLDGQLPGHVYVGVGRDDGASRGEYSAIFIRSSRFSVVSEGTFWLSKTPVGPSVGWDAALPRICTYALLDDLASGGYLWVLNTHFDHLGEVARLESARLIRQTVRSLQEQNPDIPVVVMGDFNAIPGSPPIRELESAFQDAFSSRYLKTSGPIGPFGTFNGFVRQQEYKTRIDYVFHSSGLVTTRYIVDDAGARSGTLFPSDHFPVVVDMKMSE